MLDLEDGRRAEALARLEDLLEQARHQQYIRTFIDHGEGMHYLLDVLAHRAETVAVREYCKELLSRVVMGIGIVHPSDPERDVSWRDPLSPRETEVLTLLARGESYQDIAGSLNISINTVGTHIKSIYGKLGVNKRIQAVEKARNQGILPR